jgi:hypothetical protein
MVAAGTYKNKKTGNLYVVQRTDIVNATNAQDGQRMVLYRPYGSGGTGTWYVREEQEFLAKFEEDPS